MKANFPAVFIAFTNGMPAETLEAMNEATREWEQRAARGECSWVCADCSQTFPTGMPDECVCGHQSCTDIIKRDKAASPTPPTEPT